MTNTIRSPALAEDPEEEGERNEDHGNEHAPSEDMELFDSPHDMSEDRDSLEAEREDLGCALLEVQENESQNSYSSYGMVP